MRRSLAKLPLGLGLIPRLNRTLQPPCQPKDMWTGIASAGATGHWQYPGCLRMGRGEKELLRTPPRKVAEMHSLLSFLPTVSPHEPGCVSEPGPVLACSCGLERFFPEMGHCRRCVSGAFMSLFGQVQSCSPLFPYFLSHLLSPGFCFGFTVSVTPRRQGSTITTRSS